MLDGYIYSYMPACLAGMIVVRLSRAQAMVQANRSCATIARQAPGRDMKIE